MSFYSLDDLVRDVAAATAHSADPKTLTDSVGEHLRRLLASPLFIEERSLPSGVVNGRILHRDPARGFVVATCAWTPQQSTAIHDHTGWGVMGAVSNRLYVTNYRRNDEADIPGFADVSEVSRVLVSETSFAYVRAPDEQIHMVENPSHETVVTVHVMGDLEPWRNVFDPPAKTVTPCKSDETTIGI